MSKRRKSSGRKCRNSGAIILDYLFTTAVKTAVATHQIAENEKHIQEIREKNSRAAAPKDEEEPKTETPKSTGTLVFEAITASVGALMALVLWCLLTVDSDADVYFALMAFVGLPLSVGSAAIDYCYPIYGWITIALKFVVILSLIP